MQFLVQHMLLYSHFCTLNHRSAHLGSRNTGKIKTNISQNRIHSLLYLQLTCVQKIFGTEYFNFSNAYNVVKSINMFIYKTAHDFHFNSIFIPGYLLRSSHDSCKTIVVYDFRNRKEMKYISARNSLACPDIWLPHIKVFHQTLWQRTTGVISTFKLNSKELQLSPAVFHLQCWNILEAVSMSLSQSWHTEKRPIYCFCNLTLCIFFLAWTCQAKHPVKHVPV